MSHTNLERCWDETGVPVADAPPLPLAVALPIIAAASVGLWFGLWQLWVAVAGH